MRRHVFSFATLLIAVSLPAYAVVSTPVTRTITTTPAQGSGSSESVITTADQDTLSWRDWLWDAPNRPKWATRTFLGYGGQRENTPVLELVTTQPFSLNEERTYFWQARGSYDYGELTGNIGLGYRFFNKSKNILWGVNTFFDDATHFKFKRYGIGGELFSKIFVVRANFYQAVSSSSNIYTAPVTGFKNFQRPLKGGDISIEGPVPNFEWARVVAEGYRYIGNTEENVNGGGAAFRIFMAKALELDVGFISDNANGNQTYAKAEYYFGGADFIEHALTSEDYTGTFAYLDLTKQMMQRVIRNNQVVVETTYGGQPESNEIKVHSW